ncbi:MAG: hypothetical protein V4501_07805 [Pseudomonadota bacterium]
MIIEKGKIPNIISLNIPEISKLITGFKTSGKIAKTDSNLLYLRIDDEYIHRAFPLLHNINNNIQKPDYFRNPNEGAHISVIYPEENIIIDDHDLHQEHQFVIKDIATAELNSKIYYLYLVESPSLLKLRNRYHLPNLLSFRGYLIGFHITFGFELP